MEEDDIPSPPPFFRVCGHFTVFNPSRPMALTKLLEAAVLTETSASNAVGITMYDVPGLVGGVGESPSDRLGSTEESWPSLDGDWTRVPIFASENGESVGEPFPDALSHESGDTTPMILSNLSANNQIIQTPEGLALLLNKSTLRSNNDVSPSQPRRHARWTPEEDETLRAAIELEEGPPHNWKRISKKYFSGTRNALACKGRWNKNLQPGLAQNKWTTEEDEIVLQGHREGLPWPEIADKLHGRPPEQVRNRFINDIDPALNRSPFTEAERLRVYELQAQYGNKWTQIAREIPGRSEKMVKNCWFNAKMSHRRKLRRLAKET